MKQEFLEKYMPKPDADPHGGLEAFNEVVEDPICGLKSDSQTRLCRRNALKFKLFNSFINNLKNLNDLKIC